MHLGQRHRRSLQTHTTKQTELSRAKGLALNSWRQTQRLPRFEWCLWTRRKCHGKRTFCHFQVFGYPKNGGNRAARVVICPRRPVFQLQKYHERIHLPKVLRSNRRNQRQASFGQPVQEEIRIHATQSQTDLPVCLQPNSKQVSNMPRTGHRFEGPGYQIWHEVGGWTGKCH